MKILDVRIDFGYTMTSALAAIEAYLKAKSDSAVVCTTNPEIVMAAQNSAEYKKAINSAYLSLPDGAGLVAAKKFLEDTATLKSKSVFLRLAVGLFYGIRAGLYLLINDSKLDPVIHGRELFVNLCDVADKKNYTVMFLGGSLRDARGNLINHGPDFACQMATKLQGTLPNLNVIGATSNFYPRESFDATAIAYINGALDTYNKKNNQQISYIDMLFISCNHVEQQLWLARNINKIPVKLGFGVGGAFNYIHGEMRVPSERIKEMHLEWLYRLFIQPWRIKRIIDAVLLFSYKTFLSSVFNK